MKVIWAVAITGMKPSFARDNLLDCPNNKTEPPSGPTNVSTKRRTKNGPDMSRSFPAFVLSVFFGQVDDETKKQRPGWGWWRRRVCQHLRSPTFRAGGTNEFCHKNRSLELVTSWFVCSFLVMNWDHSLRQNVNWILCSFSLSHCSILFFTTISRNGTCQELSGIFTSKMPSSGSKLPFLKGIGKHSLESLLDRRFGMMFGIAAMAGVVV